MTQEFTPPAASEPPAEALTPAEPAVEAASPPEPETTPAETPPPVAVTRRSATSGLPPWLPYFLIAVVPAVVVGLIVFFVAGGSSGAGNAAGIIDNFFRAQDETISAYKDELPPTFPADFPIFDGASVVVSFASAAEAQSNYFAILSTSATPADVYNYYLEKLDDDPWQVEIGRSSGDFTGLRFSRPDDPDLTGEVLFYRSEIDNRTSIHISVEDLAQDRLLPVNPKVFQLEKSRPIPQGFPTDVPIFDENSSVVIDTYFARQPGGSFYVITFLTKDKPGDVIDYYTNEFSKRGLKVTDSTTTEGFAIGIDYADAKEELKGSVSADSFPPDDSYTIVELQVQVATSRGRGN
ncbi:MAG TPA: hypothetical protein VI759_11165 [Dehalococcoidia bacterium]|nr:hypothetical protein [Dehalococcoidia bacterium]